MNLQSTTSNSHYVLDLVRAGMKGMRSAPRQAGIPRNLMTSAWAPAAIGAIVGASTVSLDRRRKSVYDVAKGGFVGSVVAIGCSVAWNLGKPTGVAARSAWRSMNQVRDAHWLERNPIDYA